MRNADPDGADFVVFLDTCPHEKLESLSADLYKKIADVVIKLGLTIDRTVEIWPRFLPGPWCMIKNGKIVDTVSHPRIMLVE